MEELKNIVDALAHIRMAQTLVEDFNGKRDFLEDVNEKLDDVKVYLADTIAETRNTTIQF